MPSRPPSKCVYIRRAANPAARRNWFTGILAANQHTARIIANPACEMSDTKHAKHQNVISDQASVLKTARPFIVKLTRGPACGMLFTKPARRTDVTSGLIFVLKKAKPFIVKLTKRLACDGGCGKIL